MDAFFRFLLVLSFAALSIASSHVDNRMKALLERKGSKKFSLRSYEGLRDAGAPFSPRHLKMYTKCEDPQGFLDALFKRGYVPSVMDLVDNAEDETLFEALYEHAHPNVQAPALCSILQRVSNMNYDLHFFINLAPSLGSKAGKLGLSLPQYALYFVDIVQMKPEAVTVDFLKFLHNSGIDFNSSTFARENFFEQAILEGRLDIADFMAQHGAKFSKKGASYMMNTSNKARLQTFVAHRAWKILRDLLTGFVDVNSPLQEIPSDIMNYHIVKMVMDSVLADLFPK